MSFNYQTVGGDSGTTIVITNNDVNASWNTVTANTITSDGSVFANGTVDLLALVQTKQDIIGGGTDIDADDITCTTLTATGVVSASTLTSTGNINGVDITASGDLIGDDINIDSGNIVMSDSSQSRIGFGVSDLTNDNGFRVDSFFLSPTITVPSIYMGLKGTDHSIVLAGDSNSDPAYSFVNTTTGDYQGKIVYNMNDNRMEFFTDNDFSGGNHKLKLSNTVAEFTEAMRGNKGLLLQGTGDLTITTGGDIVNSSGNIRTTSSSADIYAENSNVYATNGDVYSTNGNIYATNGDITGVNIIAGTTNLLTEINTKQSTLTTSSNLDVNSVYAKGFQVHATNSAGMEFIANTINDIGYLDFSYGNPANDYHGRFSYNFNDDVFIFATRSPDAVPLTIAYDEIYARVPIVSESNITCEDLTVNGNLILNGSGPTLQDAYENAPSAPHITINENTSTGAFQLKAGAIDNVLSIIDESDSEKTSMDKYGGLNCVDISSSSILNIGNITTDTLTVEDTITGTDDLYIGGDVLHVDTSLNKVGINVLNPNSALTVQGTRNNTPALSGGCVCMGTNNVGNDYGIEISNPSDRTGLIDFTHDDGLTDFKARIKYVGSSNLTIETESYPINIDPKTSYISLNGDVRQPSATDTFGIGTSSATSALSVCGTTHNGNTNVAGVHMALQNGNNACLELCSNTSSDLSYIDFTYPNTDKRGRAIYDFSNDTLKFEVANNSQMIISNSNVDFQGNTVSDVNLNSVKGQIVSFIGENSNYTAWTTGNYVFKYGNGQSSSARFGIGMRGDAKLKYWVYQCEFETNLSTSCKLVFDVIVNNLIVCYCIVDFSNTTNCDVTHAKGTGKFSSSATSQVDYEFGITDPGYGYNVSYRVNSNTANPHNGPDHRMSTFLETLENW